MFVFICQLSKKKKNYKELEFTKPEFHITYFYVYVYLSIIQKKIVWNSSLVSSSTLEKQYRAFYLQRTRAWYARVPYYKELEFTKFKYYIIIFLLHKF